MDVVDIQTYAHGPIYRPTKAVTTADYIDLCERLEKYFGPGYQFRPEAITEGGIEMINWPGKKDEQYKTFRIYHHNELGQWPWINNLDTVCQDWRMHPIICLHKPTVKSLRISTFLKSFYGAPCWTREEILKFSACLETIGLMLVKATIPPKYRLDYHCRQRR